LGQNVAVFARDFLEPLPQAADGGLVWLQFAVVVHAEPLTRHGGLAGVPPEEYLLAVKGNQPALEAAVRGYSSKP
jgi:hypothetical protein